MAGRMAAVPCAIDHQGVARPERASAQGTIVVRPVAAGGEKVADIRGYETHIPVLPDPCRLCLSQQCQQLRGDLGRRVADDDIGDPPFWSVLVKTRISPVSVRFIGARIGRISTPKSTSVVWLVAALLGVGPIAGSNLCEKATRRPLGPKRRFRRVLKKIARTHGSAAVSWETGSASHRRR